MRQVLMSDVQLREIAPPSSAVTQLYVLIVIAATHFTVDVINPGLVDAQAAVGR